MTEVLMISRDLALAGMLAHAAKFGGLAMDDAGETTLVGLSRAETLELADLIRAAIGGVEVDRAPRYALERRYLAALYHELKFAPRH